MATWTSAAFEKLVREHQAGLRSFIRALGADEAWVDDLAQEAFLVAYRRQEDFREGADFGKWLRGIARRLVMAERLKVARRTRLLHAALTDVLAEYASDDASAEPGCRELTVAMWDCISQLPPQHQDLLQRRYAAGQRAGDLAGALRMTAEAVRQSLHRIRLSVKRCVEAKLGEAWS